jgi:hypothetical protein
LKRLRAFRKLQRTYMPNLQTSLTPSQRQMWDSETDRDMEAVGLFLPSDILDAKKRMRACAVGLPAVEAYLRVGEARCEVSKHATHHSSPHGPCEPSA